MPSHIDTSRRTSDFRTFFAALASGQLGTHIGHVALPLVAVLALGASPGQVGILATLSTAAFLLIGLPAGAWVDRMRHRRVLIVADLSRAVLLATVPAAWARGVLTLEQLYVVVALSGCATVFFDVGSQSVLPHLVADKGLIRANTTVTGLQAAGNVAGGAAGGGLVALITAPLAVACTAVLHLVSALCLTGIRPGPAPHRDGPRAPLRTQVAQGMRHVFQHSELRALALSASLSNLGIQIINTLLPVLFAQELHLSPAMLGLYWAVGGVGILLGARCARPLAARTGYGRALSLTGPCVAPAALLIPFIDRGLWLWAAGAGWLLMTFKVGVDNVLGITLRQRLTPAPLLGRMNATFRFMLSGALTVASALSGLMGEFAGVRFALWVGAACLMLAFLPVFLSQIRARRDLPEQVKADRADTAAAPDHMQPTAKG
ncbi:MFS transporter [Streptomyces sp. G-G2]|uniref:MFS transporter n=1 Tax=Streptomyces sp. G-G2 TaxID=3046201 RepID=UPI0024BBA33A|nr:MFS transporter [Streptomyces sp. G-G2]MDJ0386332.1 MFS transporter [Streptomyces sp. G-G2]